MVILLTKRVEKVKFGSPKKDTQICPYKSQVIATQVRFIYNLYNNNLIYTHKNSLYFSQYKRIWLSHTNQLYILPYFLTLGVYFFLSKRTFVKKKNEWIESQKVIYNKIRLSLPSFAYENQIIWEEKSFHQCIVYYECP